MTAIKHIFHINAKQELVFDAISSIDQLKNWWTEDTTGDHSLNGTIHFKFGENGFIDFKVIELDKPNFYQWECINANPEWIGTTASFELSQNDGKTKVKFIHDGWKEQTDFYASCNFSWGRYFISLRNYLETGKGNPFVN